MTAVLASGERALLSHRSAAALWGIAPEVDDTVTVSVRAETSPRLAGIRAHRRPGLRPADVAIVGRIPATNPVLTLIDLANEVSRPALERAVNEADKRDLVDPETLRESLGAHSGAPGVRVLRSLLDRHAYRRSDSELEVALRKTRPTSRPD
jgi:hypothetical protein